jgi:hypothetical protein
MLLAGAALLVYAVIVFNRLVHDRNLVGQAFADIDVQLKRRAAMRNTSAARCWP